MSFKRNGHVLEQLNVGRAFKATHITRIFAEVRNQGSGVSYSVKHYPFEDDDAFQILDNIQKTGKSLEPNFSNAPKIIFVKTDVLSGLPDWMGEQELYGLDILFKGRFFKIPESF